MPSNSEEKFYEDARTMLEELMENNPVAATQLGDHRFDDRLGDLTPAGQQAERDRLGEWAEKFQSYSTDGWSLDAQIDQNLAVQIIKQFIREYDKQRTVFRSPGNAAERIYWVACGRLHAC
jgi:uncharacterized protein (DUF885 family)